MPTSCMRKEAPSAVLGVLQLVAGVVNTFRISFFVYTLALLFASSLASLHSIYPRGVFTVPYSISPHRHMGLSHYLVDCEMIYLCAWGIVYAYEGFPRLD